MDKNPVLAATDLSPDSDRTIDCAAVLARQRNTSLHLLHVLSALPWEAVGKALVEHPLVTEKQLYESAKARLNSMADACAKRHGVPVAGHVDIGLVQERIIDFARTHAVGLLVFGRHAGNPVRDLFVGATALKTVRKLSQPALIAVTGTAEPYRRVLVPVDFSDASHAALEYAMDFAPHAAIEALHVYDVPNEGMMQYAGLAPHVITHYRQTAADEALRMLRAFFTDVKDRGRITPSVVQGSPARAILDRAQAMHADLIVMGKQGRSQLDQLFLGSVAESVIYRVDRDLLLISGRDAPPPIAG